LQLVIILLSFLSLGLFFTLIRLFKSHKQLIEQIHHSTSELEQIQDNGSSMTRLSLPLDTPHFAQIIASFNGSIESLIQENQKLSSREAESRQILEQLAETVIVLDKKKRILMMNQAAKELLLEDPSGPFPEALELLGSTELLKSYEACLMSQSPIHREVKIYRGGQEKTLQISAQTIEKPKRAILIIHDISKLIRLETMRQEFVANVSHELKTPVTSILGFVETLLDEDSIDPEQLQNFLTIIHTQSNRLKNIIEDLLTLSRLEQEGTQVRLEPADPQKVIQQAIEACRYKAEKKKTRIEFDGRFSGTLPMNQPLVEQAIINLLENAIKYGSHDSVVTITMKQTDQWLIIETKDQGPGIPHRELDAIFQRFYRLDKARSRAQGGTGLGLSIVKHIARVHQGSVYATSTLGKGSTFVLKLPLYQSEESQRIS
jgi:two-component system phosphate regulon sensor histidine kinase PhoR